jgi:Chlorophyll A-B binding protein
MVSDVKSRTLPMVVTTTKHSRSRRNERKRMRDRTILQQHRNDSSYSILPIVLVSVIITGVSMILNISSTVVVGFELQPIQLTLKTSSWIQQHNQFKPRQRQYQNQRILRHTFHHTSLMLQAQQHNEHSLRRFSWMRKRNKMHYACNRRYMFFVTSSVKHGCTEIDIEHYYRHDRRMRTYRRGICLFSSANEADNMEIENDNDDDSNNNRNKDNKGNRISDNNVFYYSDDENYDDDDYEDGIEGDYNNNDDDDNYDDTDIDRGLSSFDYNEFDDEMKVYNSNGTSFISPSSSRETFEIEDDNNNEYFSDGYDDSIFLRQELARLESLEEIVKEFEQYDGIINDEGTSDNINDDAASLLWDEKSLEELLGDIEDDDDVDDNDDVVNAMKQRQQLRKGDNNINDATYLSTRSTTISRNRTTTSPTNGFLLLENALRQGVVPASAGVGSFGLPGDFGFDPLNLVDQDLFYRTQQQIIKLLPERLRDNDDDNTDLGVSVENISNENSTESTEHGYHRTATNNSTPKFSAGTGRTSVVSMSTRTLRPRAIILRDYREAEIRHGRLAMLAAVFWPLQEMLDRFVFDAFDESSIGYGGIGGPLFLQTITLPYFPLLMTAIMLLLGYLDIYSQSIKDMDKLGDAFLPGDCFWDPLQILVGSNELSKRNMQERELFNSRAAMIAIASYLLEEFTTGTAIVDLPRNQLLFIPIYQIPYIQQWLDYQFSDTI